MGKRARPVYLVGMEPTVGRAILPAACAVAAFVFLIALLMASTMPGSVVASEPTRPDDCFVAKEPSQNGPTAPSELTASWSPYYIGGILLDALDEVAWEDKSGNETCFVLEMSTGGDFRTVAFLLPNSPRYTVFSGYGHREYRVYAATATERSEYSNVAIIDTGPPPTPRTPSPSPAPVTPSLPPTPPPSPAVSPTAVPIISPVPSLTASPVLTPAQLPAGGGPLQTDNSAGWILVAAIGLLFASAVLAMKMAWRR